MVGIINIPIVQEFYSKGEVEYDAEALYGEKPNITGIKLTIKNSGSKRVDGVTVAIHAVEDKVKINTIEDNITIVPLSKFELSKDAKTTFIKLLRPLQSSESVIVFVSGLLIPGEHQLYNFIYEVYAENAKSLETSQIKTLANLN